MASVNACKDMIIKIIITERERERTREKKSDCERVGKYLILLSETLRTLRLVSLRSLFGRNSMSFSDKFSSSNRVSFPKHTSTQTHRRK